jgi:hypothetical protein
MRWANFDCTGGDSNTDLHSSQQYGLPAWGASGPYQKVYEKFGITGTSNYISPLTRYLV